MLHPDGAAGASGEKAAGGRTGRGGMGGGCVGWVRGTRQAAADVCDSEDNQISVYILKLEVIFNSYFC